MLGNADCLANMVSLVKLEMVFGHAATLYAPRETFNWVKVILIGLKSRSVTSIGS